MRVLQITSMYPSPAHPYAGVFVRNQVEALEILGVESTVRVVNGPESSWNYARAMRDLGGWIREKPYDLLHVHQGPTGVVTFAQRRLPFVLSLYGTDVNVRWARCLSALVGLRARRVIVCSRAMARMLPGSLAPRVIPPGIDTGKFRPHDRQAARRALDIAEDETVLIFPADPARPVKDFPLFESAANRLEVPRLRIIAFGRLAEADLPLAYSAADCVVLTSKTEGSPTVLKEALACACPVVAVDVGDVREQLERYPGCRVVAEREPDSIAAAVTEVLASGARPDWQRAAQDFSVDSVAARVLAVYREALSR
ncbi:MAG: glycosyltransferase [Acidobacteria bacterium]|nr:glycosyltransferase [Acidobacteriota bacterium]